MLRTYKATLTEDGIRWDEDEVPAQQRPARVIITFLESAGTAMTSPVQPSDGDAMAEALRNIAARGGINIPDPVAWQREIRQDRPLPGRED